MDIAAITQYVADHFSGVNIVRPELVGGPEIARGDVFFIYDPERNLEGAKQFPFATIVTKDYGDFDKASNLNPPGVFRLNIGVGKQTFDSLFALKGGAKGHYDFAELDKLIPHPVYGVQHWISVLNPSAETFKLIEPLLLEAYNIAAQRLKNRG